MTFEEKVLQVMMDVDNGGLHPDQAYFKMLDLHQEEVDRQLEIDALDVVWCRQRPGTRHGRHTCNC